MSCETSSCDACDPAACPAVAALRDTLDAIRRREVKRHAGNFDEADAAQVDALTHRLMQRVVAVPCSRLPDGTSGEEGGVAAPCPGALLERLFTPPEEA